MIRKLIDTIYVSDKKLAMDIVKGLRNTIPEEGRGCYTVDIEDCKMNGHLVERAEDRICLKIYEEVIL